MLKNIATELPRDTLDLLPHSFIRLWEQQEEKLLQMPRQKKAMREKPPKWPEVEQEVKTWILEKISGISVSTKMIQEEGKRLHKKKKSMISQGHLMVL